MIRGYPHIFVQVKAANFIPGQARHAGKFPENLKLRRPCCEDHRNRVLNPSQFDQVHGSSPGSGSARCMGAWMDFNLHLSNSAVPRLARFSTHFGLLRSARKREGRPRPSTTSAAGKRPAGRSTARAIPSNRPPEVELHWSGVGTGLGSGQTALKAIVTPARADCALSF